MTRQKQAIGVDFGGTNTRVALVTHRGRIIHKTHCATKEVQKPRLFIRKVSDMIQAVLKETQTPLSQIAGIGMGIPGPVEPRKGLVHFLPNVPGWKKVSLARLMRKHFKTLIRIDNDGNAMALGECLVGAARSYRYALFLTLGTGIGGGILIDGKLLHGHAFSACEIAHMRYGVSHTPCACGSFGCIETEIGNGYLLKKIRRDLVDGVQTKIRQLLKGKSIDHVSLEMVDEAARKGDRYARDFWKKRGEILGTFLGGICNLLNPEVIVIGGGVANAGPFLFKPLNSALKAHAFPIASRTVKVVHAQLGADAGLIGSASLVLA